MPETTRHDGKELRRPTPLTVDWRAELRVVLEMGSLGPALPALLTAPRGDGHGVLVMPGMYASDRSTLILRRYLSFLGYQAHPWKLGRNWGPSQDIRDGTTQRLQELSERYGRRISLIGWSLGGIYARELARRAPANVRQVITLGSPFAAGLKAGGVMDPETAARLRQPPPVPPTPVIASENILLHGSRHRVETTFWQLDYTFSACGRYQIGRAHV